MYICMYGNTYTTISKKTSHEIIQNSSCILAVFSAAIVHWLNLCHNLHLRTQCLFINPCRECINSGLDYWNGGILDWEGFALIFHFSNYCGYSVSTLLTFLHI